MVISWKSYQFLSYGANPDQWTRQCRNKESSQRERNTTFLLVFIRIHDNSYWVSFERVNSNGWLHECRIYDRVMISWRMGNSVSEQHPPPPGLQVRLTLQRRRWDVPYGEVDGTLKKKENQNTKHNNFNVLIRSKLEVHPKCETSFKISLQRRRECKKKKTWNLEKKNYRHSSLT